MILTLLFNVPDDFHYDEFTPLAAFEVTVTGSDSEVPAHFGSN
jgi:hypothetical protein